MRKITVFQLFFAAVLLTGCSSVRMTAHRESPVENCVGLAPVELPSKANRVYAAGKLLSNNANFIVPAGRKMAFNSDITVCVADVKSALSDTRKKTSAFGGYVKTLDNNRLVLAVPVAKGDEFLEILGKMGDVTNLRIEGADVTEQVSDIKIRMENLKKSRERLLKLMERTGSVRDLAQVERELNRVTTELERLQAADKNLTNRVEYVTISVTFQTYIPVRTAPSANTPLVWINQLGSGLQTWITARGTAVSVPFRVELPAKFFFAGNDYAVSGSNCNIRFREIANAVTDIRWYGKKYAGIAFYKDMIIKALEVRFGKKVTCNECRIDGKEALWFQVETNIYGTDYLYLVAVAAEKDTVKVVEAKGKKADLLKDMGIDGWKIMLESID